MSGYSTGGASRQSKVLKAWTPRWLSAGSDIDLNLNLLRSRAADLARNTPLGSAAVTTSARGVLGSGLRLYARPNHRVLGITPDEARDWSRKVSAEFQLFGSTVDCDLCRRNNFFDLQHIAYMSYLTDGDAFVLFRRKPPTPRNPYTLRLQLVEGNRVSTPTTNTLGNVVEGRAANGNRIINGIEVDADGELKAVYVSNRVPNDLVGRDEITEWVRVEMFGESGYPNALQLCHDERAGQYRGVPYLAPVVETLKQAARFTEAELSSAIVKTYFSLFFVQEQPNMSIDEILEIEPKKRRGLKEYMSEGVKMDVSEMRLGAGTLTALPRGVDVKAVDSGNAGSTFGAFTQELVTQIGAALGIPYEVLTKSFKASYSASRAALLQAYDEFKGRRAWFVRDFLEPVYAVWLTEAVALGRIEAPGFFDDPMMRAAWLESEWYGPRGASLEPLREVEAAARRIELGLSTHEREAIEMMGADYERNVEQLKRELMMMSGEESILAQ